MYDGSTKCCGGDPLVDPCSYLNMNPGYAADEKAATATALLTSPSYASFAAQFGRFTQNVQDDIQTCFYNPGFQFVDAAGILVNCPTSTADVQAMAAAIAAQATPAVITPANMPTFGAAGSSIVGPSIPAANVPTVKLSPGSTALTAPASVQVATSGAGSGTASPAPTPNPQASGFDFSWFTGQMITGIPNYVLVLGGVAALMVLPGIIGGRR